MWCHLYNESKNVELIEPESRMAVTKTYGVGKMGKYWLKGTNFKGQDEYILGFNVQHSDYS